MLLAAGAFADLSEDYLTGDPIVRWDVTFAAWLHGHSVAALISAFKVVTLAGNVAVLCVVTVAGAAFLVRRRAFNEALLVCAVGFGVEALNAGLKLAFHRPRPRLAYVHLDTYSFPSGHAAGAAAIYGVLIFLIARRGRPRLWAACSLVFLVIGSVIGFSRLYLEAHYLSDVLAGFSVGVLWLSACLLIYLWAGDRSVLPLLPRRLRSLLLRIPRKRSTG
jgi:membrane-associated phospholipid phosphatase